MFSINAILSSALMLSMNLLCAARWKQMKPMEHEIQQWSLILRTMWTSRGGFDYPTHHRHIRSTSHQCNFAGQRGYLSTSWHRYNDFRWYNMY